MEEPIILPETAKLAKSKGFHWKQILLTVIPFKVIPGVRGIKCYNEEGKLIAPKFYNSKNTHYPAPTQSLLAKWLRDVHNLHIDIRVNLISKGKYFLYIMENKKPFHTKLSSNTYYNTYEEAMEAGLLESLKLIKNE